MRDAVGDYPAHAALEETETGRDTLDALARLQLAYADVINGHSSVLAEAGFREATHIRKQKCGASQTDQERRELYDLVHQTRAIEQGIEQILSVGGKGTGL